MLATDPYARVYRRANLPATLGLIALWATTTVGCTSTPRWRPSDFFIAARYDLGACQSTGTAWERGVHVQYDFGRLASLGFDTVIVENTTTPDTKTAFDIAASQKMAVAVSVEVDQQSATRGQKRAADGNHYTPVPAELTRHKAFHSAMVQSGYERAGATRAVDVCSAIARAGLRCVPLFEASHLPGCGKQAHCPKAADIVATAPAVVDATFGSAVSGSSPTQQLLAQYHAALSGGQTGGLVVIGLEQAERGAGDKSGLPSSSRAAISSIIGRAKHWGPRLVGSKVVPVSATVSCAPCFRVTAFVRGNRRHLLVFNPAPDHFARGELRLTTSFAGLAISKVVEVAGDGSGTSGNVRKLSHGKIVIPLALQPGDAALFELF